MVTPSWLDSKWRVIPVLTWVLCCAMGPAFAQTPQEYNTRGVELYNAGDYDQAIEYFEKAYELAPDSEAVIRNLCNAHQSAANELAKVADFRAAAKHLEAAIVVEPDNYSPYMQLGMYYLRLDMVGDAIRRLEAACEKAPDNLDVHEMLGDAYYKDNDLASARAHWEWVLEMEPNRSGLREKIEKASREETVEKNFRKSDSRHFALSYPPGSPTQSLRKLLDILEVAYIEIGRKMTGVYPPTPIQVIVYNTKGFADVTQLGEHVGALYDGKIRIPLLDQEGAPLVDDELKRRLNHEYTHVVMRFLAASNVPWWLNEGLAETFSRDLTPPQRDLLTAARDSNALFNLKDLEGEQLKRLDPQALNLAYCQSHATVQYLWQSFGAKTLRAMMSSLAEGVEPEEALTLHYRRDYRRLERETSNSF